MLFSDAPPALPLINSGKVRALGVTTGKRIAAVPEIPPIGETVAGYDSAPWQMLTAPAGTPRLVVDKLHSELARYIAAPEGQKKLTDMGLLPGESTPPAELAPLQDEKRIKEIIGAPEDTTEIAIFPVAYTIGTDFNQAPRRPARTITYFDRYGTTVDAGPSGKLRVRDRPGTVVEIDIDMEHARVVERRGEHRRT